jgi:hypothetical protein
MSDQHSGNDISMADKSANPIYSFNYLLPHHSSGCFSGLAKNNLDDSGYHELGMNSKVFGQKTNV